MTKNSSPGSIEQVVKTEEMKAPRQRTLGFIRQFARAYNPLPSIPQTAFIAN